MDPFESPDCSSSSLVERVSCAASLLLSVLPHERIYLEAVVHELQHDPALLTRYANMYELLDPAHYNSLSMAAFKVLHSIYRQNPSLFSQSVNKQSFPDFMLQTFEHFFRGYYVHRYQNKVRAVS